MQSDFLESLRDALFKTLPPARSQRLVGGVEAVAATWQGGSMDTCTDHSFRFPDP